jgi:hypothetical protein
MLCILDLKLNKDSVACIHTDLFVLRTELLRNNFDMLSLFYSRIVLQGKYHSFCHCKKGKVKGSFGIEEF